MLRDLGKTKRVRDKSNAFEHTEIVRLFSREFARFRKSSFVHNVSAVSLGRSLSIVFPILLSPVLGRLYTPLDYGKLGTYMSIASVLGAIGNWQYSQAIVIEKSENKASTLVYVCVIASLATSCIAAILGVLIVFLSSNQGSDLSIWWFLGLPVSIFFGGVCNCQAAVANRMGMYNRIALVQSIPVILSLAVSITLGVFRWGATGLFCSYFAVQTLTLFLYLVLVPNAPKRKTAASWDRIRVMFRRYRNFAYFTMPTSFISTLTTNAPVFAMASVGSASTIGLFTKANQLMNMPATLVGNAIAQVFQRSAAVEYVKTGSCREIYRKVLGMLVFVGSIPTVILALFAPTIFTWFLGPNWTEAGNIARILAPTMLLRFVSHPLSTVFHIVEKQREDFALSLANFICTLTLIGVAIAMIGSPFSIILAYSIGLGFAYALYIYRSAHHSACIA